MNAADLSICWRGGANLLGSLLQLPAQVNAVLCQLLAAFKEGQGGFLIGFLKIRVFSASGLGAARQGFDFGLAVIMA